MITVDVNPQAFLAAGVKSMKEAAVLAIVGRSGLSGVKLEDIQGGTRLSSGVIHHSLQQLMRKGLIVNCGIDRKQGRPHRYTVMPAGQEVLNKAIMAVQYPDRLQTPLPL